MKPKLNIKLFFLIFALLFLILAIITIGATYSRYITSLSAGGSVELGSWLIKVNDQNIMDNSDLSEKIIPVFNKDSEYITEGKIAPTSTGSVEITIDYSGVTVPFKYDISCLAESSTVLEDFTLVSYSVDGGNDITVDDPSLPITDTILPSNPTRTRTLTLNFSWLDGSGEAFSDILDTAYSRNNDELGMNFNLQFTQLQPTP